MKYFKILLFSVSLIFVNVAFAGISTKIGVIDSKVLLDESPQAKKIKKTLELEFNERRENLLSLENSIKDKHTKLQKDKDILSASEVQKQERELNHLQQDLYRNSQEFQSDVAIRQKEEQEKFAEVVNEIVEKVAKKEQIDLVVPKQVSIYSGDKVDITSKVLAMMKSK